MLQLPHDESVRENRGHFDRIDSQPVPDNTALSTTVPHAYTGPNTKTSTVSRDGSVSPDKVCTCPIPRAVASTTLKQKPKLPPKPKSALLTQRGILIKTSDLTEAEVTISAAA